METAPKYNIDVRLTGVDGNAFMLIGVTEKAIRNQVGDAEAKAFAEEAMKQDSYDHLLQFIMRTVNVS